MTTLVSIQLMSPASGDINGIAVATPTRSFHSINVPSEWGLPELYEYTMGVGRIE